MSGMCTARKIGSGLKATVVLHLYLPEPHKGVWNLPGVMASGGEIIFCQSLIDAATFLVCRLPQCHGELWRQRLHRRPS